MIVWSRSIFLWDTEWGHQVTLNKNVVYTLMVTIKIQSFWNLVCFLVVLMVIIQVNVSVWVMWGKNLGHWVTSDENVVNTLEATILAQSSRSSVGMNFLKEVTLRWALLASLVLLFIDGLYYSSRNVTVVAQNAGCTHNARWCTHHIRTIYSLYIHLLSLMNDSTWFIIFHKWLEYMIYDVHFTW